ncbi:bifunctional riboflavin kinase/FAD synthetase [Blattabacterium cuenoti]|uniref:bifunctional riboflavin kinase/FAD synthetase n=1 Tax=Blattabacterium cuenoti TaxID=1653831 RepID=UPI00163BC49F|nr:bifunctional riboflavin kinase/FAD synthetase [Blattabacterium cuenoti]
MKIYSFIDEFSSLLPCVFTLGFFDGVHIGHQKLIQFLTKNKESYCSVLLTFNIHPKEVLNPKKKIFYLNTLSERIYHLKKTGIEHLIIHPFTLNFSKLSIKYFLQKILLSKLKIKKIITGYDSHIGKDKVKTFYHLKKISNFYRFQLYKVHPYKFEKKIISSTLIRKSILKGNMKWANKALGYLYTLSGYVIKGNGIGKKLNFPTANIKINEKKIIPKKGVYAVKIHLFNHIYQGMMNIGICPTINNNNTLLKIEVHIFNFKKNIYGKKLDIGVIQIIRKEFKFNTLYELKKQIQKDQFKIKKLFFYDQKNFSINPIFIK